MTKENAFHCWLNVDYRGMTRTLNIPSAAIKKVGFNTKNPIYVEKVDENHFALTQDGSVENIVRSINGWKQANKKTKAYRLGVEKLVDCDADSVMIMADKESKYIDVVGLRVW